MKLRVSPGFDPLKAQVGPDEYFVLSRIDGTQTLREVLLSTGLSVERGIAIVGKLRSIGALLFPGETTAPAPAAAPKPQSGALPVQKPQSGPLSSHRPTPPHPMTPPTGIAISRTNTPMTPLGTSRLPGRATPPAGVPATPPPIVGRAPTPATPFGTARMPAKVPPPPAADLDPPTIPRTMEIKKVPPAPPAPEGFDSPTVRRAPSADINLVLPNPSDEERAALAEPGELDADVRLKILAMARLVDLHDPWALLGVPNGADKTVLKRAYFKLSKDVHPDRFYGKQLGSFAERLSVVFEAVSRAYARLTSSEKSRPDGQRREHTAEQPQTPGEYAAELFERACGLEVGGDHLGAMKLFAAAVRIDPQTRYLRRAASCALQAEQPKTALEYAKKAQAQAPNDVSAARLLAEAFKATGKLADAEEVLVMAMAMKSENDVLTAELRNDLAAVRRLMAT